MQIGVLVHISVQVRKLLVVFVVPPTRSYLVSMDEQVLPATDLYVDSHGGAVWAVWDTDGG